MKKQFEGQSPYILHNHFDSPLRDFWNNEDNKDIVKELFEEWLENKFERGSIYEKDNIFDILKSGSFGILGEIKEEKLFLSGLYLLISRIYTTIVSKMDGFMNTEDVFFRLLMGGMIQEYYSTGEYGKKIFDMLDKEIEAQENNEGIEGKQIRRLFDNIIVYYLEDTSKDSIPYENIINIMKNKKDLPPSDKSMKMILDALKGSVVTGVISEPLFKTSNEGISFSKSFSDNDIEIIKGIKQIRIKRQTLFDPIKILSAVISIVYGGKELYLSFDPFLFIMNISEKKSIETKLDNPTIVINLKSIVERIFCIHCRSKVFSLQGIFENIKTNPEIIKEMFDDLFSTIDHIHPDDIIITAKGKVDDNERFTEINEKIPFGDVGFKKHNGEKKGVVFKVEKQLKNQKKKLI